MTSQLTSFRHSEICSQSGEWTNCSEWTPAKVSGHLFRVPWPLRSGPKCPACPAQQRCPGDYGYSEAQLQRKEKQKCVWTWGWGDWKTQIPVICQQHQQTLLSVCVFSVSFLSVWAGWNILWTCSLGWQVSVTLKSQDLMRVPVSCSRYTLRRDCRPTVSSKYSRPSPTCSHLWHGSQGPGSSGSVLCYLDFLKTPLLFKKMQKLNNLPPFQ